jgi:hypothetical protein
VTVVDDTESTDDHIVKSDGLGVRHDASEVRTRELV